MTTHTLQPLTSMPVTNHSPTASHTRTSDRAHPTRSWREAQPDYLNQHRGPQSLTHHPAHGYRQIYSVYCLERRQFI